MSARPVFSCRLTLPLRCERLDAPPSAAARDQAAWANDGVLGLLLHEIDVEAALRPVDERLAEALAPLRMKLDMVIDMLGRLSYRDLSLPPVQRIELGVTRIGWSSPQPVEPGEWLRFSLYFHATYREPVVLYGRGANCVEAEGAYQAQAEFDELPEATGEAFARLAFLAQRRQLAARSTTLVAGGRR